MKMQIKFGVLSLFCFGKVFTQTINTGVLTIEPNTDFSTLFAFDNKANGDVLHNGNLYLYADFKNDGLFTYTDLSNGKTFFIGNSNQIIEGTSISEFQNIEFNNSSNNAPFFLKTTIVVNKQASFRNGIVDGSNDAGKMIFNENAFHSETSNLSFVDGRVEKKGTAKFEFPVGDDVFYRPSINELNNAPNNIYTTEYFFETIGNIHPYASKEDSILTIDEAEYWNLTQQQGSDKAVLSLTLDKNTTPQIFFQDSDVTQLAIVRWDAATSKWINEKGITTDLLTGADYTKLVTTQVSGYGIFTIALVKKENPEPPTDGVTIYNALSPNGDGINDTFHIKGINQFPDNRVEIYNRWGVKVYDAKSYNESDKMFDGYSDGRATINRGEKLPTGTYFYILNYTKGNNIIKKSGYLYINNQ
ncbi:gliding motility-associated C-terminal domain-containing protein [Flavobacterium foetidum]|uniref:gliding motility-associated C-terminal domain-containing protein n=1 Tax=Flavobacterium foetidum TaxID=2026681 RepID=UPI001074E195|nr:gliding motility-associated C-terminal domain-containing protein [Flavobacterium foetidum]KAF2515550.1 gliding motility-associated C-terminal domain-containing protein [Flavobacterium foetidum]